MSNTCLQTVFYVGTRSAPERAVAKSTVVNAPWRCARRGAHCVVTCSAGLHSGVCLNTPPATGLSMCTSSCVPPRRPDAEKGSGATRQLPPKASMTACLGASRRPPPRCRRQRLNGRLPREAFASSSSGTSTPESRTPRVSYNSLEDCAPKSSKLQGLDPADKSRLATSSEMRRRAEVEAAIQKWRKYRP